MKSSKLSRKPAVRPPHKRKPTGPLHLELSRPAGEDPRGGAADSAPVVYPLRLPPRARSYSKSELATVATMFTKLKRGDDLRAERVADVRAALEHEDYENALKVEIAVERLLADLALTAQV